MKALFDSDYTQAGDGQMTRPKITEDLPTFLRLYSLFVLLQILFLSLYLNAPIYFRFIYFLKARLCRELSK